MRYILRPSFGKNYKKLTFKIKTHFKIRRDLFLNNPFNSMLKNHQLYGEYDGCRSINVTSDYRAIYYMKSEVAIFIRIGTHSELFGK